MKKTLIAMTLLLAGLSTSANAEFVTGDYLKANDSRIMLDTTSGLEWLSLSLTASKSMNNVSALIDSGGYSGFRLATEEEVVLMFDQFLTEDKNAWLSVGTRDYFMDLLGKFDNTYTYGLVKGSDGVITMYGARTLDQTIFRDYVNPQYTDSFSYSYLSIYLVSDSGVSYSAINDSDYNATRLENAASVPAPFLLGGLGLLGLAGVRRRSAQ